MIDSSILHCCIKETLTGSAIVAETNTLELIDLLPPTNSMARYLILRKNTRYTIEGKERHILITVPENYSFGFGAHACS